MKKILLTLLAIACAVATYAAEPLRYVDATTLTVLGKALPTDKDYNRIDTNKYTVPSDCVVYSGYSTGLHIVFKTNSKTIAARWTTSDRIPGTNMTPNTQKGLDLYIMRDGEWVFAGVGSPKISGNRDTHEGTIVTNMAEGEKLCLLYLPIFDSVGKLEIGIEEGSNIAAAENPFRHKIVVHGSSITHGASANRAGMTYPAIFSRRTGLYTCNLGYSGRSKLQPEFATYLAEVADANAFVFDTFSNPSAEIIAENFDRFVDIIRAKHPTTPLIFTQTIRRDTRNFNLKTEDFEARKQAAAEKAVRERMKRDKHIYFLDSEGWLDDDHLATADGTHPTDLGFMRMLEHMEPAIKKILKKYGIK